MLIPRKIFRIIINNLHKVPPKRAISIKNCDKFLGTMIYGKNPRKNFEKNMKRMGLVASETNLATFLKMHVFPVRDNSFETFLRSNFHTSLWCLNRVYEDCKGLCNKSL